MSDKNIQMKHFKDGWNNLYPVTKTNNVYNENGSNIEQFVQGEIDRVNGILDDKLLEIDDLIDGGLTDVRNDLANLQNIQADLKKDNDIYKTSVYNVKDYGAKGDGVTDDTQAIQSVIDLIRAKNTGGTVFIPRGHYLISSPIRLKSNVSIQGAGKYGTILEKTGGFNAIQGGLYTGSGDPFERVDYVSLRDFSIFGKGFSGDGINLQHCHYYLLENISVKECTTGRGFSFVYSWVGTLIGLNSEHNRINYQFQTQANSINGFSLYSNNASDYGFFFQDGYNINMYGLCHDHGARNIISIGSHVRALNIDGVYMESSQNEITGAMVYSDPDDFTHSISIRNVNLILKDVVDIASKRPFWIRSGAKAVDISNVYMKLSGSATTKAGLIAIGDITNPLGVSNVKLSNITVTDSTNVSSSQILQVENSTENIIIENLYSTKYSSTDCIFFRSQDTQRSININGRIETHLKP